MMKERRIRLATTDDAQAIADIYNQYLGISTMDTVAKTSEYYDIAIQSLSCRERIYVLPSGSDIIGWGIIKTYSERLGYRYTAETSVYLDQGYLGQGHGTILKQHIINECRSLDYHHLVAKILAHNQVSIDYNLKLGYEIVGTQREVGYIDGRWVDVVILQMVL